MTKSLAKQLDINIKNELSKIYEIKYIKGILKNLTYLIDDIEYCFNIYQQPYINIECKKDIIDFRIIEILKNIRINNMRPIKVYYRIKDKSKTVCYDGHTNDMYIHYEMNKYIDYSTMFSHHKYYGSKVNTDIIKIYEKYRRHPLYFSYNDSWNARKYAVMNQYI